MYTKYLAYFLFLAFLVSCKDKNALEISPKEIDEYVEIKSSESQEYAVSQSLRFSKEEDSYEVVQYIQNDTVILFLETIHKQDESCVRQTFFKNGMPVFIQESIGRNSTESPYVDRKIYWDGTSVIEAYEKSSDIEQDLAFMEYSKSSADIDEFDFNKPKKAMAQQGEFKMQFSEFIFIDPQTYLILENEESLYDVALFIANDHPLIGQLLADPDAFKGRTIFITHQFIMMNNIERMLFIDGEMQAATEAD